MNEPEFDISKALADIFGAKTTSEVATMALQQRELALLSVHDYEDTDHDERKIKVIARAINTFEKNAAILPYNDRKAQTEDFIAALEKAGFKRFSKNDFMTAPVGTSMDKALFTINAATTQLDRDCALKVSMVGFLGKLAKEGFANSASAPRPGH